MTTKCSLLLILSSLVVLAACEDPGTVGLGLVEDAGGVPIVTEGGISEFAQEGSANVISRLDRFMAGQVNDPLTGEFNAIGYIDFTPGVIPAGYSGGTVDSVSLLLEIDYVFGDTTQPVTIEVFDLLEEIETSELSRDNLTPASDAGIFQFSFMPTDTAALAVFPADWITTNNARLRSSTFATDFHGFKLVAVDGNAIVGFRITRVSPDAATNTALTGTAGTISHTYFAGNTYSEFNRLSDPQLAAGRVLIQEGVGPHVELRLDFSDVEESSLNRAALELRIDTTLYSETPDFVRPQPAGLNLFGIFEERETCLFTSTGILRRDGTLACALASNVPVRSDGAIVFETLNFRSEVQNHLLDLEVFDYYEIQFPITSSSISVDAFAIHDTSSVVAPPTLVLTYTQLQ